VEEQVEKISVKLKTIVATSLNNIIGVNGKIPWHCSEDLKRFKSLTKGSIVVMGRRTWESIGSVGLPGRANVVISSRYSGDIKGCPPTYSSIGEFLARYNQLSPGSTVWFIGGEKIYDESVPISKEIYLTRVEAHIKEEGHTARWNFTTDYFDRGFQKEILKHTASADYGKEKVSVRFIKHTRLGTI
jgi:dihydrofolate reductase